MTGVPYQGRLAWTRTNSAAARQDGPRKGVAVHWPGFRFALGRHPDCLALVARLERDALAGDYSALPYNEVACPHGYRIEGRGPGRRSGANGSAEANDAYGSVLALVPIGGKPTDALLLALHASLTVQAPGRKLVTHNAIRPEPTACPGPALTAWIDAGAPRPAQPGQRRHTVKPGDTLWALAVRYYGNGDRWPRIAKANDLTGTDLAVGDRLTIP
jgi:hypothetical protein